MSGTYLSLPFRVTNTCPSTASPTFVSLSWSWSFVKSEEINHLFHFYVPKYCWTVMGARRHIKASFPFNVILDQRTGNSNIPGTVLCGCISWHAPALNHSPLLPLQQARKKEAQDEKGAYSSRIHAYHCTYLGLFYHFEQDPNLIFLSWIRDCSIHVENVETTLGVKSFTRQHSIKCFFNIYHIVPSCCSSKELTK